MNQGPMRQLLIVRHGLAHCNVAGIVGGTKGCTGLTPLGRTQVHALAEQLAREPAISDAELHTSTARRCAETAQILAARLNLDSRPDHSLREPDHGTAGDGRTWPEIIAAFPGNPADQPERPLVPGGETWRGYLGRACRALDHILTTATAETVIISGHAETVRAAYQYFLGLPETTTLPMKIAVDNASVTRWIAPADRAIRWTLTSHNDNRHCTTV